MVRAMWHFVKEGSGSECAFASPGAATSPRENEGPGGKLRALHVLTQLHDASRARFPARLQSHEVHARGDSRCALVASVPGPIVRARLEPSEISARHASAGGIEHANARARRLWKREANRREPRTIPEKNPRAIANPGKRGRPMGGPDPAPTEALMLDLRARFL
jgi:hypothetical protein